MTTNISKFLFHWSSSYDSIIWIVPIASKYFKLASFNTDNSDFWTSSATFSFECEIVDWIASNDSDNELSIILILNSKAEIDSKYNWRVEST